MNRKNPTPIYATSPFDLEVNSAMTGVPEEKILFKVKDAAKKYGIGRDRMYDLARNHLGRFSVQKGRQYLIMREKFEAFLKETSAL